MVAESQICRSRISQSWGPARNRGVIQVPDSRGMGGRRLLEGYLLAALAQGGVSNTEVPSPDPADSCVLSVEAQTPRHPLYHQRCFLLCLRAGKKCQSSQPAHRPVRRGALLGFWVACPASVALVPAPHMPQPPRKVLRRCFGDGQSLDVLSCWGGQCAQGLLWTPEKWDPTPVISEACPSQSPRTVQLPRHTPGRPQATGVGILPVCKPKAPGGRAWAPRAPKGWGIVWNVRPSLYLPTLCSSHTGPLAAGRGHLEPPRDGE